MMMPRTLRADAARNHQALLCAARTCFALHGEATQMDDVAAAAGVGVGTLYRHFPTKADLITALMAERLTAFIELLGDEVPGSAWERLSAAITAMVHEQSTNRALAGVGTCEIAATRPELRTLREEMGRRLEALIAAATAAGAVRADITVDDVLMLCFNGHLADRDDRWATYASIVIDGLRAPVPKGSRR